MLKRLSHGLLAFVLLIGTIGVSWSQARADIDSCSASVSPHTVVPGVTTDFSVVLTNTDTATISWVRVTRPSTNFTILSNSSPGWQSTTSSRYAFQTGGSLLPGQSMTITITAQVANNEAAAANWTVQTSEQPGVNIFACSGSLDTAISGFIPDTDPPVISNVAISSLSNDSATVSWTTDEPATTQVNYGLDSNYGSSTPLDSNLATDHSATIAGLVAGTGYHFQVRSVDSSDNIALSADNTFLTPSPDPGTDPGTGGSNSGGGSTNPPAKTRIPIKSEPTEDIPPVVSIATSFKKPYATTPKILGEATDNEALAGIEYSTDGGQNWLPVDKDEGLGTKKASFEFTPLNLYDGNYSIVARAIDTSGNIGVSSVSVLVIDKLSPSVGGAVMSIGPQIMNPDSKGVIYTLAGIDQKVTISAVGGPTKIKILAKSTDGTTSPDSFNLTQMTDSGLWSGVVSIKTPGTYRLVFNSVDGAGNETSQTLGSVYVAPQPQLLIAGTDKPVGAQVEVYYLEPESNSWTLWDGASYGQANPQQTDAAGRFKLFLPQGKYYLKAKSKGYRMFTSDIFELSRPQPLSAVLNMRPNHLLSIGAVELSLPAWSTGKVDEDLSDNLPKDFVAKQLIDKNLPVFSLTNTEGKKLSPIDLLGKPTMISVMTTWSPSTSRQIGVLSDLQSNQYLNVVPVALQEKAGKVRSFTSISGNQATWLVDPDNKISGLLGPQGVPVHYFVDRHGVVKSVLYGFIDKEEAQSILENL